MPEYLSPGVYVEEISTGPKPIEGVSTSTAGFAGRTERGPTTPRLVTSWLDFQRWFGSYIEPSKSFLPYSIQGFFQNGGKRAFVARVINGDALPASQSLAAPSADSGSGLTNVLKVESLGPGTWGNNIIIRVTTASRADLNASPPLDLFRLTIAYFKDGIPSPFVDPVNRTNLASPFFKAADVVEDYDNLSAVQGSANYVISTVNAASKLVHLDWGNTNPNPAIVPEPARPSNTDFGVRSVLSLATSDAALFVSVSAVGAGLWGDSVSVEVLPGTKAGTARMTIRWSTLTEDFDNLSTDITKPDFLTDVINGNSRLIRAEWVDDNGAPIADLATATLVIPDPAAEANLAGGLDDPLTGGTEELLLTPGDFAGKDTVPPDERTGLAGLEAIDEISLVVVPDEVNPGIRNNFQITNVVLNQCERLKDRFGILSVPKGQGTVQNIYPVRDTSYGGIYYPWVRVFDQRTQDTLLIPPSGHVAGIYARTDIDRGVHKAPANEVIRGIITRDLNSRRGPLEYKVVKGEQDILNPRGINVIRDFRTDRRGIRVWGARTMSSDGEWKYVNVRRLFIFIEESLDEGTQWVVFEPNHEPTWARVVRSISNFLVRVWRDGALQGVTEEEAFFVRCDRTTMTQDDIDNGRLICYVGIAPVKPAEFVIIRIGQKTLEATQ